MDPWFSPAVHLQAIRRCWRIGQTKEVDCWWLYAKDSIEDRILQVLSLCYATVTIVVVRRARYAMVRHNWRMPFFMEAVKTPMPWQPLKEEKELEKRTRKTA